MDATLLLTSAIRDDRLKQERHIALLGMLALADRPFVIALRESGDYLREFSVLVSQEAPV